MWERGAEQAFDFATCALGVSEKTLQDDDPFRSDIYTVIGALKIVRFQSKRECGEAFQKALDVRSAIVHFVFTHLNR
jgi:hypothetical protein